MSLETNNHENISFSLGFTKEDYRNLLSAGIKIKGRRMGSASLFIEIQSGRPGKSPFFLIGPQQMLDLMCSMAIDHPLYCAPPTWFLLRNPERYIADTAAFLAREILSIKPDGPFLLGGYCFNGWISYEIARILKASKKDVDLLFFLDDRAPKQQLRSLLTHIGRLCFPKKWSGYHYINETGKKLLENYKLSETHSSILERCNKALNYYKEGRAKYEGHIDVVLHSRNVIINFLDRMDWKRMIRGRLRIAFLPGSHDWKNNVQIFGLKQIIKKCFVEAHGIAEYGKNES